MPDIIVENTIYNISKNALTLSTDFAILFVVFLKAGVDM